MLKDFTPRLYQETILATCTQKNTLVVLPTGMGKTAVSLLLGIHRLTIYPKSKILILSPTKPLCQQHVDTFRKHMKIEKDEVVLFTGSISPEKRKEAWRNAKVIVATPQSIENDVISNRIPMEDVSLVVFDEAHRAVGEYAYVFVAKQYNKLSKCAKILALTASPGSDMEKIKEVCKNLFIEEIEIRTDEDPDVKPYIKEISVDWIGVELPPVFKEAQKFLSAFLKDRMKKLKDLGLLNKQSASYVSKKDLLQLQSQIRIDAVAERTNFTLWNAISVLAEIMKIYHGQELLETQGVAALHKYLEKLQSESRTTKTKAVKNIVRDLNFRSALIKAQRMKDEKLEHPKLVELQRIVEKEVKSNKDIKIIVFNQYRDNAQDIEEKLNSIKDVKAKIFVGQMKKGDTGLSQKEQIERLEEFKTGEFNVLIATTVGEEGLDIPLVDIVIFYEPVPSAVRTIQRRGRTGRQDKGRVIILYTKGTRDESYKWSSHHKEKRMYRNLQSLRGKVGFSLDKIPEKPLQDFIKDEEKIKIYADYREKGSRVIKELVDSGFSVMLSKLEVADYLLSKRVGVEFKKVEDFVQSIIDVRLLQQVKDLKRNFEKPLLVIEGVEDIYSIRNVHPNAVRGMLATIAISYGIPVLYTKSPRETAELFSVIAKRENSEDSSEFNPHGSRKPLTLKEQQEYIVSSLPGIGPTLAKPLLKKFGSVKKIVNAKPEKLEKVEKIGKQKAKQIKDVVEKDYII